MTPLLRMEGISKHYGGVRALEGARLACARGRIHAVLGENGAGKSTLIKVLAGVVQPDAGTIELAGEPIALPDPAAASRAGIVSVFQELSLLPDLSVADNIGIVDPPRMWHRTWGPIDRRAQRRRAEAALARVGAGDIHPLAQVRDLPLSRRQMVEIAKALARDPKLLLLDEATSALTAADVASVFRVLRQLRDDGLAIVFISHRMQEIAELADDCSVYRNGCHVASFPAGSKTSGEIIEMMIGREHESVFPPRPGRASSERPALAVKNLSWAGRLRNIDLEIRPGEVVGLGGLDGQGQRDLLLALFGALTGVTGSVAVHGVPVTLSSPQRTRLPGGGIALIPEDRKTEGLMLPMSVRENLSFAAIDQFSRFGWIDRRAEEAAIASMIRLLGIRADGIDGPVAALSGGNQQKVVIGKWLMTRPQIILLNDPTRGIDVGTKQELYRLLRELADGRAALLFYSTDYDELIGCCDRVLILYDGAIVNVLEGDALTEHNIVASAHNLTAAGAAGAPP
ncbi:MAG: sugar ABC transporter ATP-binding protein [Deltaproteobacteria bacterium]|nr:MAG: sugar ABC transporter ATP-binding protein [Deltaproteobacteria bacterium]TMQ18178.1 MAG: sugar ABC transporter ATP-binding protein [Deltaproteobacteria bacterium]